ALVALAVAAATACRPPTPVGKPAATPSPTPPPLSKAVRETLARLPLEARVAQMVAVRASGLYQHADSAGARRLRREVRDLKVGSLVVFESEVGSLRRVLERLQAVAEVPLLVSADMERGLSFRVRRGVVPLPYAMAIGATRSEDAARFSGEVAAREARALGLHWALAPVADVNNNPANPVINIRSYGEDPELVARMAAAFIRGARQGGLLTTVKHFPGHGDTAVDSHLQMPTLTADRDRLDLVELLPFRMAVDAGVDAVMLGHIAVPSLDPSGSPATLSAPVATTLLRRELGFRGLVVTDALEMAGVRKGTWTGEAAVKAVRAGADVILLPPETDVAIQSLVRAVREGILTEARIDASVGRILAAKESLGLLAGKVAPKEPAESAVGRPEDVERALEIARQSITVVRNEGGVLPLRAEEPLRILHLVLSSDPRTDALVIQGFPEDELARRRIPFQTVYVGPDVSEEKAAEVVSRAEGATHVLASVFARVAAFRGTADMPEGQAALLRRLQAGTTPLVILSFGSPYLLRQVPEAGVYVCAYGWPETSQRAAIAAVLGEHAVGGKLPVTLPDLYDYGHGLNIPRRAMTLRVARPEEVGFREGGLAALDGVIDRALAAGAFPGGVVAVGRDGALAELRPFGRFTYDPGAPAVKADTVYDLASLTKVVVTTTVAMILVDEGRLDLARPVSAFIPSFRGGDKDKVTVEHLLTHSSGVDWWAPLYKEIAGQPEYVRSIVAMDLKHAPGAKALYSDLGLILLGEILQRVAGEPLDTFARKRILEPLGMKDTLYRPGQGLRPRIAPAEIVAERGGLVHGVVHDENAMALGGVAPHAGLFGTAPDLARFAQMMLDGGVFEHQRIVSRATVEQFTGAIRVPGSSRAYGWEKPTAENSAGARLSPSAFGHTGFTGTSMWIDPARRLFVILLTNRVHPTRENSQIRQVRKDVHDAAVDGLAEP
ncbi:MAG TPA: glycoside hydrolase family 3 N-terminal domain-containing protein, partial [Vicinamibacteria bacterium]|nr:glycoside hydrolase family 3 N-terminal domain-containing protein [Vicinamibacteria bacterium]